jgi:hypothetical protein
MDCYCGECGFDASHPGSDANGYCSSICYGQCGYYSGCDCGDCPDASNVCGSICYGHCGYYSGCDCGACPDASTNCSSICYGHCGSYAGCNCGTCFDASTWWPDVGMDCSSICYGHCGSYAGCNCGICPDAGSPGTCDPVARTGCSGGYSCYWNGADYGCEITGKVATGATCTKDSDCIAGDGCLSNGTANVCFIYCYLGYTCADGSACSDIQDPTYGVCG